MRKIEVCLTPELIHQHQLEGKIVVVVDIFRATSCMVAGLGTKVKAIYPVAEVKECFALGETGKVMAGERGGQKVAGFDIGNSPYDYMCDSVEDKEITVSTTNGTQAIAKSQGAKEVLIGAFLNLSAIVDYIQSKSCDVLIHCAGWKGTVNLEDTLFAGAVVAKLIPQFEVSGDPAMLAKTIYDHNQDDLLIAAKTSSHAHRLCGFGVEKDLEYCMQTDVFDVVPKLQGEAITL